MGGNIYDINNRKRTHIQKEIYLNNNKKIRKMNRGYEMMLYYRETKIETSSNLEKNSNHVFGENF